jgi:hypothetical protein
LFGLRPKLASVLRMVIDSEFYIDGTLNVGTLTFTVVVNRNGRRGSFAGRQFFDALMAHFGARRVKVISAVWSDVRPGFRTNLDIFNTATGRGISNEQAAFATKNRAMGESVRVHGDRKLECQARGFPRRL